MNSYQEFLKSKQHSIGNFGIDPNYTNSNLFDFQQYIADYSIKKGRCANFLDTGLGKTLIELVIAKNYVNATNKPVLIITPLAVAYQFIKESEKFDIDDVEYSKVGKFTNKIVICNYERLHYFNSIDFDCVICDESSLLKNCDGATRNFVTAFLKKVQYRYLFTATPSPNDYVELGTSSEALGYLGYSDMLTKFFTNNEDTISPMNIGTEWILKGHAKENFFKWVSGWSISMRKQLSHIIWQRYASSVWDDIRIDEVLPFRDSKEEDDEKHVHPLQLDVIDRCVELWSNPGEVVLTPFAGVGSEVFSPVSMGRKAKGIELKDSYYKQMVQNLKFAKGRFLDKKRPQLFDSLIETDESM